MIEDIEPKILRPDAETFRRFDEVLSQLIDSSDMLDYGEEEFESWCKRLLVECRIFKHAEYQSKNPRHPKGLIRHLKKCLTDLNKVRANFWDLPEPYIRHTWSNSFDLDNILNFEPQYENKFSGFDNSPHGLLTNSAVALSMTIARAVREGPISRAQAPKKDFAN